jgi:lysophospholipase L1-like esterase
MRSNSSRRSLAARGSLFAATLVVCLLMMEAVIAFFGLAPDVHPVQSGRFRLSANPLIGYELVPNFESKRSGPMLDFVGRANGLGFRDREHALEKPESVTRVIVLGDSIAQGLLVERSDDVFSAVAERELNGLGGASFEVLNFGVSGYDTRQEVATLREKGLSFTPDVVVLAYCVNDITASSGYIVKQLEAQRSESDSRVLGLSPTLARSALVRWVYLRIGAALFASPASEPNGLSPPSQDTVAESLARLGALAREHDFDVVVAWIPKLDDLDNAGQPDHLEQRREDARANALEFLDLSGALRACAKQGPVAVDALHPNVRGHACIGRAIARHVHTRTTQQLE